MDVETNATCGLADHFTLFESIINTLDAVVLHANEEARAHLSMRCASVEQRWAGVGEVAVGHQVVRLDGLVNVFAVDSH